MVNVLRLIAGLAALALVGYMLLVAFGLFTALDSAAAQYASAAPMSQAA